MMYLLLSMQLLLNPIEMPKEKDAFDKTYSQLPSNQSGEEDLATLTKRYLAYNQWANQQMAEWLSKASEEQLNSEIESSFSSLKETIFHIWNAEYLWLQIVKGEDYDNSPAKNFDGTKDELMKGWLEASNNFYEHIKNMSVKDLNSKRSRKQGDGDNMLFVDMIHHCMNHSTYHRGQLITMGRQAGLNDPPRTDFLYYVILQNQ